MARTCILIGCAVAMVPVEPATTDARLPAGPDTPPAAVPCAREGRLRIICTQRHWEDLDLLPGGQKVLASSFDGGGLYLVDRATKLARPLYPSPGAKDRPDRATYGSCVAPDRTKPLPLLGVRAAPSRTVGIFTVFATRLNAYRPNIGPDRVGVEVFELDMRGREPAMTWIGCVLPPNGVAINSVALLPDGGFLGTNFNGGVGVTRDEVASGRFVNEVWEWHPRQGWSKMPGSEMAGPNGILVTPDGRHVYVAAWGDKSFVRLARGIAVPKRDEVRLDYRIDNIHWAPDGTILAAGFRDDLSSVVVAIDPGTLAVTKLYERPSSPAFKNVTAAVWIGEEIWLTSPPTAGLGILRPDR